MDAREAKTRTSSMSLSFTSASSGGRGRSPSSVSRPCQYLVSYFVPNVKAKTGANPPSTGTMKART